MEVPFPHEAKNLQAGLDDHKSHAAANDAEGDIQKPEENDIFYVPEPFKTKRSHLFFSFWCVVIVQPFFDRITGLT